MRLEQLHRELVGQAARVQGLVERAYTAAFTRDQNLARVVQSMDDDVDRVDVDIEKASVQLLTDATHEGARLEATQLRAVLTIVKINNELERVADCGVAIADLARSLATQGGVIPPTFQVMANSVVGILRDAARAYDTADPNLAKLVLQSEHLVTTFKTAILRDAEHQIATGRMSVDMAMALHEIAYESGRIADHCTNLAEQVIYVVTGAIVRHMEGKWVEVAAGA